LNVTKIVAKMTLDYEFIISTRKSVLLYICLLFMVSPTINFSYAQDYNEIRGTPSENNIDGTDQADLIGGLEGADNILAMGGNDLVQGDENKDDIRGGLGDDMLQGNEGNDRIRGEEGNDIITGGEQDDYISGGEGDDKLFGSLGDDVLEGGPGADSFQCDDHNDAVLDFNRVEGDVATSDCEVITQSRQNVTTSSTVSSNTTIQQPES
jgi:Ca2+-binding RTX toxin-like protein